MKIKSKSIYFPIQITITISFFIVTLFIVSIVISFNYINSSKSALLTAEQLMEDKSQQIFMKIDNLYNPMTYIAKQASALPSVGVKPSLQTHPAEEYMLNAMKLYRQIQIQFIGFQDGDFYCIYSLDNPNSGSTNKSTHAPDDARFAILRQYTPKKQDTPVRLWRYLNDKGQTIGSFKERVVSYDPRLRGWYQKAIETDAIVKSHPYLFDNSRQFGVTVSTKIDGSIPGVYGVDIFVSEISQFLSNMKGSERETILIFNSDMQILASSESRNYIVNNKLLNFKNSGSEILVSISEKLNKIDINKDLTLKFKFNKKSYLAKIMEIPDQFENKEYILIYIPQDEILGPIAQNTLLNLFYSFILFSLSIPIIFFVSKKISGPIMLLSNEAAMIHKHDFSKDINIKSRIKEINELTREMTSMKRGLRHFNKYVPARLVRHLLESNTEITIGGTKRNMSIMFTDIVDFTTISENLEPEILMKHLSFYFDKITTIIRNHNGIVDKYIGDAVMAFWNAPNDDPDHVINACRAAIEINKYLNEYNTPDSIFIKTRIGIDTGEVVVGNVGSSDRMNYTVIGDVVNNSSRLESINRLYQTNILISEKTAGMIKDEFLFYPVAKVIVKGKTKSQTIYELIDYKTNLNSAEINFIFHFNIAFELYYRKMWVEAEEEFLKAESCVQRKTTQTFLESCREFIKNPPETDWSGVRVMRKK